MDALNRHVIAINILNVEALGKLGSFQREAVGHLHLVPDNDARGIELVLILLKAALLVVKDLLELGKDLWQKASLGP